MSKTFLLNSHEEISCSSRYAVCRVLLHSFTKQSYVGVREPTFPILFPSCWWSWVTDAKGLCRRCMGCLYFVSELTFYLKEEVVIRKKPEFFSAVKRAPVDKWPQFSMCGINTMTVLQGGTLLEDMISQTKQRFTRAKEKTNRVTNNLKTEVSWLYFTAETHNKE